ncbi:MAG: hypothetical protein R3E01_25450 [Pirellulaceae bacterium]
MRRTVAPRCALALFAFIVLIAPTADAEHQTATVTTVDMAGNLPYRVQLREVDFGPADRPTLQSYVAGHYDGKWLLIAGRTTGLHGFENNPGLNFPVSGQNRDVWVIDLANRTSWHRSLQSAAAGLTDDQIASLTSTNLQFYQQGERLYTTGGYGVTAFGNFATFDSLTAIDLPGMIAWTQGDTGTASQHLRQVRNPLFQVTGGAMFEIDGRTHLILGQDFRGGYTAGKTGIYTEQIRSFDIVDDGTTLSIANPSTTPPDPNLRRRDLNVFPILSRDSSGEVSQGIVALSGVFTPSDGAWTVPVEIDATGLPTMADPSDPSTFKQPMNNYHSAKVGLYSASSGAMHEILFGGISLQYVDETTGEIGIDDNFPFVNDITSVVIRDNGSYSQHHLGYFPELTDPDGNRLRFGANAEFFRAEGIEAYANGVINMDELTDETVIGYVYGGIAANAPHVRGVPGAVSGASNRIFEVVYIPVPEPGLAPWLIVVVLATVVFGNRRR